MSDCRRHFKLQAKMERAIEEYLGHFPAYGGDAAQLEFALRMIDIASDVLCQSNGSFMTANVLRLKADFYANKWRKEEL